MSRLLTAIVATVLVAVLAAPPAESAPSPTSPLLIVGSVTPTGARILYDRPSTSLWPLQTRVAVRVFVRVHIAATADVKASSSSTAVTYELLRELVIESPQSAPTVDDGPRVLVLDDLLPGRRYIIGFQFDDGLSQAGETEEEVVRFRTPRESGGGRAREGENTLVAGENGSEDTRVLVVSCDRYVDDGDDALWERVAEDMDAHASSYFGMAHIGDQVYVDAGARGVPITPVPDEVWADARARRGHYDVILGAFRRVYRETFGRPSAQHVLRHGAHWMLPDDHEVLNNFNTEHVRKVFGKRGAEEGRTQEADEGRTHVEGRTQEEDDGRTEEEMAVDRRRGLELHYRAGLQALYEFQYQLHHALPWAVVDFFQGDLAAIVAAFPLHFDAEIGRLKLFFLDLRFDRSLGSLLNHQEAQLLVSGAQRRRLEERLGTWQEEEPTATAVVLAGMPLFLHSQFSAEIVFAVEQELYPGHPAHRPGLDELFTVFQRALDRPRPALRLLVGGDVHMLAHTRVCDHHQWRRRRCLDQLVTSGITRGSTAIRDLKLLPFYYFIGRLHPLWDQFLAAVGRLATPWRLSVDRMFFGRNYGVLELDAAGHFEWRKSVVLHESVTEQVIQWTLDLARPWGIITATVALVVLRRLLVK